MADRIVFALPPHALGAVLLGFMALLAIGFASGAFEGLIGTRWAQAWDDLGPVQRWVAALAAALWLALLLVTLVAGLLGALALAADPGGGGLGLGALLVGLLGAPFLVWATVIRQTTLD